MMQMKRLEYGTIHQQPIQRALVGLRIEAKEEVRTQSGPQLNGTDAQPGFYLKPRSEHLVYLTLRIRNSEQMI